MQTLTRPNIVFITADQLRKDALSCYGNSICRTPAIDRLAAGGLRFENAYTVAPVCSPARASLMTGLYPHRHGVMLNTHIDTRTSLGLASDVPTFSAELKRCGYQLGYFGKWHVSEIASPVDFGFDSWENIRRGRESDLDRAETCSIEFRGGNQLVWGRSRVPVEQTGWYGLANQAADYITKCAETADKPFFCRFDMTMPHFPNVVPEPYASQYDGVEIPEWRNFDETFEGKPAVHRRKHEQWSLQDKGWNWWREVVRMYYADISYLDHLTGILLDALDRAGIADRTVVIFTADHGDSTGSHKLFEKGATMYDEVMNVPLIIRWPGTPNQVGVCTNFVRNMDLMPTFISLAGGKAPDGIDATDLTPLFVTTTQASGIRASTYSEYHGDVWGLYTQRMVVSDKFKYVFNPYDVDELYDRVADPYEMNNLARHAACRRELDEMRALMRGWFSLTHDVFTYDFVLRNFPDPVVPGIAPVLVQTKGGP